jgi:hypothetical protein
MDIVGVLYPGYHRPLVTARQPEHDRLYQQPNGRSRAPSVRDGPATPKPSRREGATYPKGIIRRCELCCLGPSPPPLVGNQTAHRSTRLGISGPYRMCPTGYDDKPHIPPLEGSQPPDPKAFHIQTRGLIPLPMHGQHVGLRDPNLLHQGRAYHL